MLCVKKLNLGNVIIMVDMTTASTPVLCALSRYVFIKKKTLKAIHPQIKSFYLQMANYSDVLFLHF